MEMSCANRQMPLTEDFVQTITWNLEETLITDWTELDSVSREYTVTDLYSGTEIHLESIFVQGEEPNVISWA